MNDNLIEQLKEMGASEVLLNNPAISNILKNVIAFYNDERYINNVDNGRIIITERFNPNNIVASVSVDSRDNNILYFSEGKIVGEIGLNGTRIHSVSSIPMSKNEGTFVSRMIKNRTFSEDGLEQMYEEVLDAPVEQRKWTVGRVYRASNGYLAKVEGRDASIDPDSGNINEGEYDFDGYVNLDLRTPELSFGGTWAPNVSLGDILKLHSVQEGQVPHRINPDYLKDSMISKEGKEAITKGIEDTSPEETRKWANDYIKEFEIKANQTYKRR